MSRCPYCYWMMSRRGVTQLVGLVLVGVIVGMLSTFHGSHESQAGGGYFPGQASPTAAAAGITVTGVGRVPVQKPAKRTDRSIAIAVAAAQRAAFPKAAAQAREHAEVAARSVALRLGDVESVAETEDTYSSGAFGRFGAGRYCGFLPRRFFSHGRWVRRVGRRRTCIVPREAVVILAVRYQKG
jgi:hypothetical protein